MRNSTPILFIILIVAFILGLITFPYLTADTAIITVTEKERIVETNSEGGASSKYLVFTEDETFENTDSLAYFKFGSSDLQGKLRIGQSYRAKVYGWRIKIFSSYRNIVNAEPVDIQQ